ncbi:cytochrome P450 [Mycobacterium colombiense]|uniref:Cytochrome P450 n=1 Tax=Mycobacterium colombiense TaxID=339268 RepID=A0A1A2YS10_9MYCO|nr:cytochrome P450 [Mycobacterium colombiense]OBI39706.1 cytochrome P450 [Mycobacterium colombiense]
MTQETTDPVRLPPGPRLPMAVQGAAFLVNRDGFLRRALRDFGPEFTLQLPTLGSLVVVSGAPMVKEIFTTGGDFIGAPSFLGDVIGPGSTFSLNGADHRARRKLLIPPFHGKRMHVYEQLVEEEVLREVAGWPDGHEFASLPSMMRITLNAILRAVFGAEGAALQELRHTLPPAVLLASHLTMLPSALQRDLGRYSPGGRLKRLRRRCDEATLSLIGEARRDPNLTQRADVLALLLQARYDDGSPITDDHIVDELTTLMAAGHETTATTLAWAVERLRRHPRLLERLRDEVDAGESHLRQRVIWEVQRTRPVISGAPRQTHRRIRLGPWVLPQDQAVLVSFTLAHQQACRDSDIFDPDRFGDAGPDTHTWIPYGGGVRRCIGAAFANLEMDVTLRMLLQQFDIQPTTVPPERHRSRGIATAPARGGLIAVRRRGNAPTHCAAGEFVSDAIGSDAE